MNPDKPVPIFEILKSRGVLSTSTQRVIRGFMDRWKVDGFRACIETNIVEESKMADILSDFMKLQRVARLPSRSVSHDVFKFVPYNLALEHTVFPFEISSDGSKLKVAIADPTDPERLKSVAATTGKETIFFVAEKTEIVAAIQRYYPLAMQLPSLLSAIETAEESSN
jgi:type IV pilus assembly protein PilB